MSAMPSEAILGSGGLGVGDWFQILGGGAGTLFGGPVGTAIGSAAGSLLDRAFSGGSSRREAATDRNWRQWMDNTAIRRRVEDAQAAGVHPLFALGANIPAQSPSSFAGGESSEIFGPAIRSALARAMTREQREEHELRLRLLASQGDLASAQAQYWRSQAGGRAVNTPPAPSAAYEFGGDGRSVPYREVGEPTQYQIPESGAQSGVPGAADLVKPQAAGFTSGRSGSPGITAAVPHGTTEIRIPTGRGRSFRALVPSKDVAELIEPVSEGWLGNVLISAGLIGLNVRYYGLDWLDQFKEVFRGADLRQPWNDPRSGRFPVVPQMVHPFERR